MNEFNKNDIENAIDELRELSQYVQILESPEEFFQHMQGHTTELSLVLNAFDIAKMRKLITNILLKQISISVKYTNGNYDCPSCNTPAMLYSGEKLKFCKSCGQKLEW